jgi:phenylpropionate dioxygenase-like ring-hydroxylating dioxygenase large terminal subunit
MTMIWNQWYTACASSRLGAGPVAAKLLDQEVVLWRDAGGVARAHLDRCCHRGYKLSLSRVVDGHLECGFHGWRYDASGACVHVPSLRSGGRVPTSFCIPRLECVEKDGYVWVWMTRQGVRPRGEPGIPEFEASRWLQGSMDMACAAAKGIEINLDGAHVYFVHPSHPQTVAFRQRGAARADSQHEVRITDRGLVMFWPPAASASEPIPAQAARIQFELPNLIRIHTPGDGRTLLLFFVPTGPRTCRLEYLITQPNPAGPRLIWLDRPPEILEQDRLVLEVIQQTIDRDGDDFERSVEADAVGLMARKVLRLAEANEWETGRSALEPRRTFECSM